MLIIIYHIPLVIASRYAAEGGVPAWQSPKHLDGEEWRTPPGALAGRPGRIFIAIIERLILMLSGALGVKTGYKETGDFSVEKSPVFRLIYRPAYLSVTFTYAGDIRSDPSFFPGGFL